MHRQNCKCSLRWLKIPGHFQATPTSYTGATPLLPGQSQKIPSQTVSSSPCFCSRHLFRDLDFSKEEKLRATCASLHQTLKNSDARERCVFSRERQSGPKTPNARFASPHTKSERRQNNPEESFLMFPGKINTSEIQFTECAQEIKPASIGCRVREAGRDHGCVFRLAFRHVLLHRGGSEGSWYRTAGWGGSGTCQVAASSGESSYIAKEFDAPSKWLMMSAFDGLVLGPYVSMESCILKKSQVPAKAASFGNPRSLPPRFACPVLLTTSSLFCGIFS
ncbi:uncharacterized protein LOC144034262 isoform X4 [Vanacampus margaritifer]